MKLLLEFQKHFILLWLEVTLNTVVLCGVERHYEILG